MRGALMASFADEARAGGFLFVTPSVTPTSCSTSALCTVCWRDLSDDEVEAVALRVVRKIQGPRARFLDPP
jgi:hypothetical protein